MRHQDGTTREGGSMAQQGLDEMVDQMENYQDDYSYQSYGPKDHYTLAGFTHTIEPSEEHAPYSYYEDFAQDLVTAYNKGYITLSDGDTWMCIDDAWRYGYGGTSDHNPWYLHPEDGSTYVVWLGRVADLEGDRSGFWGNDPHEITGIFTMHETGHCYGVGHYDGDYSVKDSERYNVTPMATAYVCPQDRDTCFEASNDTPSQFCTEDNEPCEGASWCDPCSNLCRHTSSMTGGTNCDGASNWSTKEKIYRNTPLE